MWRWLCLEFGVNCSFNITGITFCDLYMCFHSVCDGCTSSTRRFAWGLCVHMMSCSEVGSAYSVFMCLCVFVCRETCCFNSDSLSVFSGPVSWSVLSLRRGSAEWTVCITRRHLWKELWWLLIESGLYLPTYCRFSPFCPHSLNIIPPFPCFLSPLYLLTPSVQLITLTFEDFCSIAVYLYFSTCMSAQ